MGNPYRGATPPEAAEPIPDFTRKHLSWWDVLTALPLVVPLLIAGLVPQRAESLTVSLATVLPALAISVGILLLEPPYRRWRERRYARVVAMGVIALEAKVEALRADARPGDRGAP